MIPARIHSVARNPISQSRLLTKVEFDCLYKYIALSLAHLQGLQFGQFETRAQMRGKLVPL
jgi:hypothetical protein